MPGPPKQFDRDEVLSQATRIFWAKGYDSATIQDIVAATGVNPASLYGTFGGKAALFAEVVEHYLGVHIPQLYRSVEEASSGLERVHRFLDSVEEIFCIPGSDGCLCVSAAMETPGPPKEANQIVAAFFERCHDLVSSGLEEAVKSGELKTPADIAGLTMLIMTVTLGLGALHRSGADVEGMKAAIATVRRMLGDRE